MPFEYTKYIRFFLVPILYITFASQTVTASKIEPISIERTVSLMTTPIVFKILSEDTKKAETAINAAILEIERIEHLMSEWIPESGLSKVNQNAGIKAVPVEAELFRLIQSALEISELSEGKFDISFKSAGRLWDFRTKIVPSQEDINSAIAHINYKNIQLDRKNKTVFLNDKKMSVGLGGIAKGYAVDRAGQIIKQAGFSSFTINAGGDLYAANGKDKPRWTVGIKDPVNKNRNLAILPVSNASVATSGDYERYFEQGGVRYHHIIDPDTGIPARLCRSVTIIAPRAYLADALATAVFVLGPVKGMALVESLPDVESVIVNTQLELISSSGLKYL